jgi:hypothetical protein
MLRSELGGPPVEVPSSPALDRRGATFVSLHWRDGDLQGCIGSLAPQRSIADDIAVNVVGAALRDPRAKPMGLEDVDELDVEVSVLSPMSPIAFDDEASAAAALRPGIDGVVLEWNGHRGTFLPVVWEQVPERREFLRELKRKAGLPRDFWADDVRLSRYTTAVSDDPAPSRKHRTS